MLVANCCSSLNCAWEIGVGELRCRESVEELDVMPVETDVLGVVVESVLSDE